jgi:hypothetical protein
MKGDTALAARELLSVVPRVAANTVKSTPAKTSPSAWLELVDGSVLAGTAFSVKGGAATIALDPGGELRFSTRDIRHVRLKPENDAVAKRWRELLAAKATADRIVIRKSDEAIDALDGVVRDVTDETVKFDLDGDVVDVKRAKIHGLVYYQAAGRKLPDAACIVHDAAGMKLHAAKISFSGDLLRIETPTGLAIVRPLDRVTKLDFSAGKIVYLSDVDPESVEWTPLVGLPRPSPELEKLYAPRRDRALFGGKLQLPAKGGGTQSFDKGLALHSRTRIVYRLSGQFRALAAVAGIDSRVRDGGHVRLTIHADERKLFDAPITGKDPATNLDLDVRGAQRLTILVDFGDDLDVADHLNLCDARVTK